MNDLGQGLLAIVSGIILVAIVSVIVAPRSSAPAGVAAVGDTLAKVIHAAVNPVATAAVNGVPTLNAWTSAFSPAALQP
jgi:hypothetical protein